VIATDLAEDPNATVYMGLADLDTEKCFQYDDNDIVEKLGSRVGILCYVACSLIGIWSSCEEEFVHVDVFSSKYLGDGIMDVHWIDSDPDRGRIEI
jgi:hypothetical protein